jgi:hypothetical protein
MFRFRFRVQVRYGHFKEYFAQQQRLNEINKDRGWPQATFWVPTIGTSNELIGEIDYPDLATFQRVGEAFGSDAEAMGLMRSGIEHIVEGSGQTELFETPIELA